MMRSQGRRGSRTHESDAADAQVTARPDALTGKAEVREYAREVASKYMNGADGCVTMKECCALISSRDPSGTIWKDPDFRYYVKGARRR